MKQNEKGFLFIKYYNLMKNVHVHVQTNTQIENPKNIRYMYQKYNFITHLQKLQH